MRYDTLKNSLLLLFTAFIWGSAFVAQSVGMDYVEPFTFTAARSFLGAAVLLPVIAFRSRAAVGQRTAEGAQAAVGQRVAAWKAALPGGVLCGVLLCIATNLQQIGIRYSTVGKSGFITAMYIVLVPVVGVFFHKRAGLRVWIAVALALVGLYLLCMKGDAFVLQRGDWFLLGCALAFTFQILAVDHYAPLADNVILSCIEFATCGVVSFVPMLLFEEPNLASLVAAWLPIVYAGVLSNGVAYTLQFVAQRRVPPATASLLMSMESVFSVLSGWVILHQTLSARELLGCACMFAAILYVQIQPQKESDS